MQPQKALNNFSKLIESGNFDDLSLTIYCSYIFTDDPLNVEDLIIKSSTYKVVIDSSQLAEHIDLLKTISNADLIPVKKKSSIDARIYYVFENKGHKIFDVAMWGDGGDDGDSMYINGKEFKANDIFLNVIDIFVDKSLWE